MEVELELPAKPEVASVARRALQELTSDLPGDLRDDVSLLATELIGNSLRHSDVTSADHISLKASVADGAVTVKVCDPGSSKRPALKQPDLEDVRGRGLLLVDALAGKWGICQERGTCVWFELPVRQ